jgi:hypothetical protein
LDRQSVDRCPRGGDDIQYNNSAVRFGRKGIKAAHDVRHIPERYALRPHAKKPQSLFDFWEVERRVCPLGIVETSHVLQPGHRRFEQLDPLARQRLKQIGDASDPRRVGHLRQYGETPQPRALLGVRKVWYGRIGARSTKSRNKFAPSHVHQV